MGLFTWLFRRRKPEPEIPIPKFAAIKGRPGRWSCRMGWRYVSYSDPDIGVYFQVEPMVEGPDTVNLPTQEKWAAKVPASAAKHRLEIIERLKTIQWNRELEWVESSLSFGVMDADNRLPVSPGSVESTEPGKILEQRRFFEPDATMPFEQARAAWIEEERKFAATARGRVTIFESTVSNPRTVFAAVQVPALKANPGVVVDWRTG